MTPPDPKVPCDTDLLTWATNQTSASVTMFSTCKEEDLSKALTDVLSHPELERYTQPTFLLVGGHDPALAASAATDPLLVLVTGRFQLGLDMHFARPENDKLVVKATAELKGPKTKYQISRLGHFKTPHTAQSRATFRRIEDDIAAGTIDFGAHDIDVCLCEPNWLHLEGKREKKGLHYATIAQTSALGFLEAAKKARPDPVSAAARGYTPMQAASLRVNQIDEEIRGTFVACKDLTVDDLSKGYFVEPAAFDLWCPVSYTTLLAEFVAVLAPIWRSMSPAVQNLLHVFAARVWAVAPWTPRPSLPVAPASLPSGLPTSYP